MVKWEKPYSTFGTQLLNTDSGGHVKSDRKAASNVNPDPHQWPPSSCYNPCIQVQNSPLRPAIHHGEFENVIRYGMDKKEQALDTEMWECPAVQVKTQVIDLYAINCQPQVRNHDGAMSFITQVMNIVVALKLRWIDKLECTWFCIDTVYWPPILTVCNLCTMYDHAVTVSMSLRWASIEHQWFSVLPLQQWNGCAFTFFLCSSIRSPDRLIDFVEVVGPSWSWTSMVRQWCWFCILYNHVTVRWHLPIITILAASIGKDASNNIAIISSKLLSTEY
jgi:hypothetical protein